MNRRTQFLEKDNSDIQIQEVKTAIKQTKDKHMHITHIPLNGIELFE